MLTLASCFSRNQKVSLFWDDPEILIEAERKFGVSFKNIRVERNIFSPSFGRFHRLKEMRKFDAVFFLSDGSIPLLFSKKNMLLLQFPIYWRTKFTLYERIKLLFLSKVIYNSRFVEDYNVRLLKKSGVVLYPPVPAIPASQVKKENTILSVGRFTTGMNRKKQEFLISVFREHFLNSKGGWKLVLVGSVLSQEQSFLQEIRKMAEESIEIHENPSYKELIVLLQKAKIYWHAAGVDEDLGKHPERAEHFGISIVEAMSAGCVPVIYNAGGAKEIVKNGENGFLYQDGPELVSKTKLLMEEKETWKKLSGAAIIRANDFSPKVFYQKVESLL